MARMRALAVLVSIVLASSLGAIPQAQATYASKLTARASVRLCASTSVGACTTDVAKAAGTKLRMVCWRDGSWFTGAYSSNRWFYVKFEGGGDGFVHSSYVGNQTTTPNCKEVASVVAGDRALAYNGKTYASPTDASRFTAADWKPGPVGQWSGDCAKFARIAWWGRPSVHTGHAVEQYKKYKADGKIKGGLPPRGALVFWPTATSYGHVAVSLGGGYVATTQGLDEVTKPVVVRKVASVTSSLGVPTAGWALP